ncbi:competence protein ComER [Gracilibacillus ureilyticus]|uniref:Competence protein ComER n=1 Tax=Gracilibacillus ureilyticus TaxID=531814 RepID=A0A1H9M4S6_9BACI|nr:late competence protein ComER [Gracilibacillus ureilyticus]SER18497.1 competence protein ComER [Gracilibacillus ureilyticus]
MKWGIIGTGNMGQVLTHAFVQSQLLNQNDLHITNRTIDKALQLRETYPNIHVEESVESLIDAVDTIFVCVKPNQMIPLFNEIKHIVTDQQLVVSITSALSVEEIESLVNCNVARMIPSITNQSLAGVSLVTFSDRVDITRKELFLKRCKSFSEPVEIEENIVRIASDIVSCGPAFFAYLAQKFIHAASESTEITQEKATILMEKMFEGFGTLLADKHFSLEELIDKVCVTGGITGVGISSLEKNGDDLFTHLIRETHHKFDEEKKNIAKEINHFT